MVNWGSSVLGGLEWSGRGEVRDHGELGYLH